MQFWVYLLHCADGSFYTGHTDNLERRIGQHEQGLCCDWTRRRRPVRLVWADSAPMRLEALKFERRVKNWSCAKKIAMIEGDWDRVGYFAKPPHERPSTALGTNENFGTASGGAAPTIPFVPSEGSPEFDRRVEGRSPQP